MLNSREFIAMQSSLDYLWMKQQAISQNIANASTPGYKVKSVSFQEVLSGAQQGRQGETFSFQAKITTRESTSARPDGNNVDLGAQSLELYQTYVQSAYVTQKLNTEIANTRYVIKQAFK